MALRLVQTILPEEKGERILALLREHNAIDVWSGKVEKAKILVRALFMAEQTERLIDVLEKEFGQCNGFRIVLLPVEAVIPRIEIPEPESPIESPKGWAVQKGPIKPQRRLSRQELYTDIADTTQLTGAYLVTAFLSAMVAATGIVRDNPAVVIGAMVIAPLLGPNVALSLATTLGDFTLARNSLRANLAGVATAFLPALLLGMVIPINLESREIVSRTYVGWSDIGLALASGVAGALAFTSGVSATLIGVMVAVALMPPLVTFGLLIGAGELRLGWGAFMLLISNIICVNLAGVVTFIAQGIRPTTWWKAKQAKRATLYAIAAWLCLLALLAVAIVWSREVT